MSETERERNNAGLPKASEAAIFNVHKTASEITRGLAIG